MAFIGDVEFVSGRSPSKTIAIVLRRCLKATGDETDGFLRAMSIKPEALFREIDDDWSRKPFLGQHVFKVVQAAGYGGTENNLWLAITDQTAPYRTTKAQQAQADILGGILGATPTDPKLTHFGRKRAFPGRQGNQGNKKSP